jgi:hypothetical protein
LVEPFDHPTVEKGHISVVGGVGSAQAEGRFIEIVAPAGSIDQAEALSYSILGLIALCMGDNAIGEIVFSEAYETSRGSQKGEVSIPVIGNVRRKTLLAELQIIDEHLGVLLNDGRIRRAITFALRWYEKGIRTTALTDAVLAHVTAIEAIVTAYAADKGPLPAAGERQQKNRVSAGRSFPSL